MNTSRRGSKGHCQPLAIFLCLFLISVQAFAQPCEDAECMGEEIMEAAALMTNAACDSATIAESDNTGTFTATAKAKLDDACTRSKNWVNAGHRKDDFVKFGKRKKSDCYLAEVLDDGIGNDDGVCTDDEKGKKLGDDFGCVEAAGNDNGVCEIVNDHGNGKKKVWEQCLEVCDEVDPEFDDGEDITTMKHMAGAMRDAAGALDSSNAIMLRKLEVLRQVQAVSVALNGDDPSPVTACTHVATASVDSVEYGPDGNWFRANTFSELQSAVAAARALENAHDICIDAADTTFFGADYPVICIPAALGAVVATVVADEWELLDDTITSTRIDNMTLCLEYLGPMVEGIDAKLDEIIDLLNMPQGQRPEFPKKD